MNEKIVRRSLKTIGTLYAAYGTILALGLAGASWTGMKLGKEGISQFINISNIPSTFVLFAFLFTPAMICVCFAIAYALFKLKSWGCQLAIGFNLFLFVLVVRRLFWPIELSPSQIDSLITLLSKHLAVPRNSLTLSDVVASFPDGIGATEFTMRMLVLTAITIFCMHQRVRNVLREKQSSLTT